MELADYAAANSHKATFGSGGVGSMGHLTGEMFTALTKTPGIMLVAYRGGNQLITDTMVGQSRC
jgi:tripartite-type tricarboxylate transporter receptor subunit TctC